MRVGLTQHACPPTHTVEQNRQTAADMIRDAAAQGAQLVVTQELFDGPYFPQVESDEAFKFAEPIPGKRTQFLCDLAKDLGIFLTGSCFEKRAPGLYHNTSVMIDPSGSIMGIYRKMHIPDDPRFYEKYYFTPGDAPSCGDDYERRGGWKVFDLDIARVRGLGLGVGQTSQAQANSGTQPQTPSPSPQTLKTGLLVCWDQWYPEAARLTALQGAQLICYPTAIGWQPEDDAAEHQRQRDAWVTIQRSHAIANGVFVAAVNRHGREDDITFWGSSFIAAPGGAILAQAPADEDAVLVADCDLLLIDKNRQGWPFLRDRRVDAYAGLLHRYLDGT